MMNTKPTIVWFRQDLRLADNPALAAALARGGPVIPLYIWARWEEEWPWAPGAASRWWLHHSLEALDRSLQQIGSRLVIRRGDSLSVLRDLIGETGAGAVTWSRRYEPAARDRDEAVREGLMQDGIEVQTFNSALLFEPEEIANRTGGPYQVFTQFWNACLARPIESASFAKPAHIPGCAVAPGSLRIEELKLLPSIDWAAQIRAAWTPGEQGALDLLQRFVNDGLFGYTDLRDRPDLQAVSRLSPHLHFGEIGPRQIYEMVWGRITVADSAADSKSALGYLRQLGWREFAHHLLFHYPHTTLQPLRESFYNFPWRDDRSDLKAWQQGRTGYPLVDAGMRELWSTGWMHNRVRMVTASFLFKDLLIPWRDGARWFWDTLVDADLANNSLGWQWVAGCGADAAPYFRVFNPVLQSRKFDPNGEYIRRWVPELSALPTEWIHCSWEAPASVLRAAGVVLGATYPRPIVDHAAARERAVGAFAMIRRS